MVPALPLESSGWLSNVATNYIPELHGNPTSFCMVRSVHGRVSWLGLAGLGGWLGWVGLCRVDLFVFLLPVVCFSTIIAIIAHIIAHPAAVVKPHARGPVQLCIEPRTTIPPKPPTMASSIAGVLADVRNLCSFIASQREAGVDISAVVNSQFSSLRARFSQSDFNVNEATALTGALRGGPWSDEQQRLLASTISSRVRWGPSAGQRKVVQDCQTFEGMLSIRDVEVLEDQKLGLTVKVLQVARRAWLIGLKHASEKTFGSMTACIIVYANFGTMSDQSAYDLNQEVKKATRQYGISREYPWEALVLYPRDAWGLPDNMLQYAYPKDDPPAQNPLTDLVNTVRNKLALRSSSKNVRNTTAPNMCATMAANTMSSTQFPGGPMRALFEFLKSQMHDAGSQPSSPATTLQMLSPPPKTDSSESVAGVAKALTLANFNPRARLAITDGTDEASKLASSPPTGTNAAQAAVTFAAQDADTAVSALAKTEEAQRASLFFGNKKKKGEKPRRRINGKRPAASVFLKKKKTKGKKNSMTRPVMIRPAAFPVMIRPAASPKSGRPKAPYGSAKSPPPPTLWNGAKVYTSFGKQGYRVLIRETDKVDKLFKWYGDHCAAWARVCEAIETARASGN